MGIWNENKTFLGDAERLVVEVEAEVDQAWRIEVYYYANEEDVIQLNSNTKHNDYGSPLDGIIYSGYGNSKIIKIVPEKAKYVVVLGVDTKRDYECVLL